MIGNKVSQLPERTFWKNPLVLLASAVVVFLPAFLLYWAAQALDSDAPVLFTIPICLLLAWGNLRLRETPRRCYGMRSVCRPCQTGLVTALAVAIILIGTSLATAALIALTGWAPDISRFESLRGNWVALLVGLAIVWTIAAFGEELLFRGYLMYTLYECLQAWGARRSAWPLALLLTAIAFGAAHAYQGAAGVVLTTLIGLGFGLVFFVGQRNLWAPILTHGGYDTFAFFVVFLNGDRLLLSGQTAAFSAPDVSIGLLCVTATMT